MCGFAAMTLAAEVVIQMMNGRKEAGEITVGSLCLCSAGAEVAGAK